MVAHTYIYIHTYIHTRVALVLSETSRAPSLSTQPNNLGLRFVLHCDQRHCFISISTKPSSSIPPLAVFLAPSSHQWSVSVVVIAPKEQDRRSPPSLSSQTFVPLQLGRTSKTVYSSCRRFLRVNAWQRSFPLTLHAYGVRSSFTRLSAIGPPH